MKLTFCDKCGGRCLNKVIRLMGVVEHFTSQEERVGEDELRPKELCGKCGDPIIELLGIIPIPMDFDRMARSEDVPPPPLTGMIAAERFP